MTGCCDSTVFQNAAYNICACVVFVDANGCGWVLRCVEQLLIIKIYGMVDALDHVTLDRDICVLRHHQHNQTCICYLVLT